MGNVLPSRQREQMAEARINANHAIAGDRNRIRSGVDEQTEIPARGAFHHPTTFDAAFWQRLFVKAHPPHARQGNGGAHGRAQGIREGNARELVPLPFEPWTLGELLETALPGSMGHGEHALQRVTGNAEGLPVVGQQIMEALGGVVEAVAGIQLQLANGPIPDAREVPQPVGELAFLRGGETQLELPLDHATPVSGSRCTA